MSKDVADARIGSGFGWFYAAAGAFLFALLFSTFGGMLGSALAAAGGRLCIVLTVLFIAVGFWTRLFGLLERRLIDIQYALTGARPADEDH
jgi:hypothetical protein